MISMESNEMGRSISSQIELASYFPAEYSVQATIGCDVLVSNARFNWMLQEFINNCAEKVSDGPILIGVQVLHDESTNMFRMRIDDNVAYERVYAEQLVTILNGSRISHLGKRDRIEVTKGDVIDKWMFVPHMRRVVQAWGGDLIFSLAEDNTIRTDVSWNKTAMFTIRPPQLNARDVFEE